MNSLLKDCFVKYLLKTNTKKLLFYLNGSFLFKFLSILIFILCSKKVLAETNLFIMAGQSNMQGYAGNALYYPCISSYSDLSIRFFYVDPNKLAYKSTHSDINDNKRLLQSAKHLLSNFKLRIDKIFNCPPKPVPPRQWTILGPQWRLFPSGHFGPEISFARLVKKNGYNPAIFKYSKESTSLAFDWLGPYDNGLYDDFIKQLRLAIDELKSSGEVIKISGFIWIQGESDAIPNARSELYLQRLDKIISHLRKSLVGYNVPIILGADETNPHMLNNPYIEQAQQHLAHSDACIARSSMRGLEKADFTHLTPSALIKHGERLYETFIQLTKTCPS